MIAPEIVGTAAVAARGGRRRLRVGAPESEPPDSEVGVVAGPGSPTAGTGGVTWPENDVSVMPAGMFAVIRFIIVCHDDVGREQGLQVRLERSDLILLGEDRLATPRALR